VFRSVYGFATTQVATALRGFAGLSHVTVEAPGLAARALDWMDKGMDFTDALHLTQAEGCDAFVSFDRKFARLADRVGAPRVRVP
jgi:predicted nucleic acid-binding protein